jgi:hypothetical protein
MNIILTRTELFSINLKIQLLPHSDQTAISFDKDSLRSFPADGRVDVYRPFEFWGCLHPENWAQSVSGTSEGMYTSMRLSAGEDFVEFRRLESFKTYNTIFHYQGRLIDALWGTGHSF